jgi:hypothetical protein
MLAKFTHLPSLGAALTLLCINRRVSGSSDEPFGQSLEFTDPREVEMAARCCRTWVGDLGLLDMEAVTKADRVTSAGMQHLPRSPYVATLRSAFLIDVHGSFQSGVKELRVSIREWFAKAPQTLQALHHLSYSHL